MVTAQTYPPAMPIWCAGCGHFGVQGALCAALDELEVPDHEVLILAGIGCSGTIQNNMGTYGYHALHGRVLPTATGVALSDPELTVVAAGGDGDGYAIGAGHLIHTFRRNPPLMYLLMNNSVYGLTKGQPSPTAATSAAGTDTTLDGILLGLSIPGSTFLARGFARRFDQLRELTVAALQHARSARGFAFLEVLSPCVTYNDTYPSWDSSIVDLDGESDYNSTNRTAALARCMQLAEEGRIPVGLIYSGGSEPKNVHPGPAQAQIHGQADAYIDVTNQYRV